MKALTISQPFASLIASGAKFVENRRWPTSYRGELAIHAGRGTQYMSHAHMRQDGLPIGAVVAIAELQACIRLEVAERLAIHDGADALARACCGLFEAKWLSAQRFLAHAHTEGPFCWVIGDVHKFGESIPARGQQGLWDWDEKPVKRS